MKYLWDKNKAASNLKKHGVDFADAVGVLEDEFALWQEDETGVGEQRFVAVGRDFLDRVSTVVFTYRGADIRLISARKATKSELTMKKDEYDFSAARRGAVVAPKSNKTRITIRIDTATLDWFRRRVHEQGGGSYQGQINAALQLHIEREEEENWEARLRRIIREELASVGNGDEAKSAE